MVQNFPDDVIVDIFSRLPAKSLYRFLCVCRSWPALIRPHLNNKHQKLFFLFKKHYSILESYDATYANASTVRVKTTQFNDLPFPSLADAELLTSCDNCLFLSFHERKRFLLLNPSTRAYRQIPAHRSPFGFAYAAKFGICCDYSSNGYTVVSLRSRGGDTQVSTSFFLKNNSWKEIRYLPNWISEVLGHGASVNGAPHFVCRCRDHPSGMRKAIFCLDLKGNFKFMPPPPDDVHFCLAAMGGKLGAYVKEWFPCDTFLVWEMKQHEVSMESCWTQVCRIDMCAAPIQLRHNLKPLAYTKEGEVLMTRGSRELIIYSSKKNTYKTVITFDDSFTGSWRMGINVDSFIALGN